MEPSFAKLCVRVCVNGFFFANLAFHLLVCTPESPESGDQTRRSGFDLAACEPVQLDKDCQTSGLDVLLWVQDVQRINLGLSHGK